VESSWGKPEAGGAQGFGAAAAPEAAEGHGSAPAAVACCIPSR
jgi:hypothetical protein